MPMAGSNSTSHQTVNASGNSGNATTPGSGGGTNTNMNTPTSGTQTAAVAVGSSKTWELSDYELHRTPQEAVTDGSEIAVSPRALHSELMCPICLDMLHNTMTTKECLHRFCAECIITALRSGNKECPTCRKKLVSKRSLRHDPNFDQLISKIYPSRDEYEAQQQKAMARLSKSHNQLALASSIEEGMKAQSQYRKPKQPTSGRGGGQSSQGGNNNGELSLLNNNNADDEGGVAGSQSQAMMNINAIVESVASTTNVTTINGGAPKQAQSLLSNTSQAQNPTVSQNQLLNSNGPSGVNANNGSNNMLTAGGVATLSNQSHAGPSPAKISRTDSAGDSSNTSGYSEEVTEVELVFKPHPDMITSNSASAIATAQNQTRFIKTTANASVEHLAKYLGMRLALDSQAEGAASTSPLHNCTIYVSPSVGASFITIPQNQTLAQVCEKYWRVNKPLEMYYSWKRL